MKHPDRSGICTWDPSDYQVSSAVPHQWAADLIADLPLTGREAVLDIGCGDGEITAAIARMVPHGMVTGIDLSAGMVRSDSNQFPPETNPNMVFLEADADTLPFSCEFDLVHSYGTLDRIADHRQVLAGIAEALRPGGRVVIRLGGTGTAHHIFRLLGDFIKKPEWSGYFTDYPWNYDFFDPARYRDWLTDAGLIPVRVDRTEEVIQYSSWECFYRWIQDTWLPWITRVPEGERSRFIREFIDTILLMYPAVGGVVRVDMVKLSVEAVKPER